MSELLADGLTLTALGMGTVFVFLTVLVVAMAILKKFVELFPEPEQKVLVPNIPVTNSDHAAIAAVAAAVTAYKHRK